MNVFMFRFLASSFPLHECIMMVIVLFSCNLQATINLINFGFTAMKRKNEGSTSRTVSNQIKWNKSHVLDSIVFFFPFRSAFPRFACQYKHKYIYNQIGSAWQMNLRSICYVQILKSLQI